MPAISARAQLIMLWWGWITMVIFGLTYYFLIGMLPLPPATQSAQEVAAFYKANSLDIRIGGVICSWTSAFVVPVATVVALQMARLEKGFPIWSVLAFGGGMMMSIFLVLPPLMWATAAFSPDRPAEITLLMHEFANLTLVTTDQYFIFLYIPLVIVSFTQKDDPHSPFPRWYGWYSLTTAVMFELGAFGFIPRTGPLAWNGLLVFWIPFVLFGLWLTVTCLMIRAKLKHQPAPA